MDIDVEDVGEVSGAENLENPDAHRNMQVDIHVGEAIEMAEADSEANTPPEEETQQEVEVENQSGGSSKRERRTLRTMQWTFLEHKGPLFAPPYEPLPLHVRFFYDSQEVRLSVLPEKNSNCSSQEVASLYAKVLHINYAKEEQFQNNFFEDWRNVMPTNERELINNLSKCDFKEMQTYYQSSSGKSRNRWKLSKKDRAKHGYCKLDGFQEKIDNFKVEPPCLFEGLGDHLKKGKLKYRVKPEDVTINCSKDSSKPEPPHGHRWKEVRHDNTVSWLASWTDNIMGGYKYISLDRSTKLKTNKDKEKYDTARKLHKFIDKIREDYRADWEAEDMEVRQRAVALYLIDRLALRVGNEKDDDTADTVGCCSLRVEHIQLHREKDGKEYVVILDFFGKASIRYYNVISVEQRVFYNLELFKQNKQDGADLFDKIDTQKLNKYLNHLMPGLTTKVFRTYNASITLQSKLNELYDDIIDETIPVKIAIYESIVLEIAALCNHQKKAAPKKGTNSGRKRGIKADGVVGTPNIKAFLQNPVRNDNKDRITRVKSQLNKAGQSEREKLNPESSKMNYLDPRITVAWCKKQGVPLEKIFRGKRILRNFAWARDISRDYVFK